MMRRRQLLLGGAALGAGAALDRLGPTGSPAAAATEAPNALALRVPFEGLHQAGILTPRPARATLVAFDAIAANRAELAGAIRELSVRGRALAAGYETVLGGNDTPTPDSGVLGVRTPPDALTATIGFGASLFDDRYGLRARRPDGLKAMPVFPDDALVAEQTHGDVLLQLCAGTEETVINAVRDLMRATRGALVVRWKVDGFLPATREPGAQRNLLGFKDGTGTPDPTDRALMNELVWRPDGGTFAVVRIIRNRVEFWDRVARPEQELMIGRDKAHGAPLGRQHEQDDPGYADDSGGERIPLDAHIRLARPRTPSTETSRILRRGYNYNRGVDGAGQLDMGLIFCSFQRDLVRQFEATQHRLAGEPLVDYVVPTGGGYFFLPRGARDGDDWVGSDLMS